jgi:phage baseplate assembly protein V
MLSMAELERRISNLCQIGTISEVYKSQRPNDHDDYALFARVDIMGRVTDFFPVMSQQGSFKKHYVPPQVGEQVMVLCPFGNANVGYILRGVFHSDGEPITHSPKDSKTEYIQYSDGTKIEVSLEDKKIKLDTQMDVEVKSAKSIDVTCKDVTIKANSAFIDSPSIDLGKGGLGIVTQQCVCAFTGNPHVQGSTIARAKI